MGSKLRGDGVEFPDGSLQITAAASSISTMEIFYASANFVKPVGVTRLEITLVGGGAAGLWFYWHSGTYTANNTITYDANGVVEAYGSETTITIQNTTHKARGGWIRQDQDFVDQNLHTKWGGQAGYLGEAGFGGITTYQEYPASPSYIANFGSIPEYPYPIPIGGSGYGFEGGTLKDFADQWYSTFNSGGGVLTTSGTPYMDRNGNANGWSGGAGGFQAKSSSNVAYPYDGGDGGGSSWGALGGDSSTVGSIESGKGHLGGGGGAVSGLGTSAFPGYVGGGGGGAGGGGGGAGQLNVSAPTNVVGSGSWSLAGGSAGQVVTFQIDVPSAEATYPIVIGTGGDGVTADKYASGGGGQGVAIIKY